MACLRPEFTRALAKRMSEGDCIDLISSHGQGRRRTLDDLRGCLPASMPALQANLRDYPRSLTAMLTELSKQAGIAVTDGLKGLLDQISKTYDCTLIILHNFDELQPGTTTGYDDAFFEALNEIRKCPGISLLCVSEQVTKDWPLQIENIHLPPLTREQALAEIARRYPTFTPEAWPDIAAWLVGQPAPYSLLDRPETWPDRYR